MKAYIMKLLREIFRDYPEIVGRPIKDSILEIDPDKRYLMLLPSTSSERQQELVESLIKSMTPTGSESNVFAIFADNIKIIEVE